ncbi:hypothetical protein HPB49_006616 [Dermacentor silvarum]|uniref:Uncharacterized protein n=1 Tax=Dermacentor silvarum TaxID=543639 RepID=A0ACB8CQ93_DERSI|nr:hypothetical protein HPB49_006616 [Dermacentor silvarum]
MMMPRYGGRGRARKAVPGGGVAPAALSSASTTRSSFVQALQQRVVSQTRPAAISPPSPVTTSYCDGFVSPRTVGGTAVGSPPAPVSPTTPPRTAPVVTTLTPTGSPNDEMRIRASTAHDKTRHNATYLVHQEMERSLPSHFPRRPAHGKLGRPIQLIANHFSIEIPDGNVYHYDVEIYSETSAGAKVPEQKKYRCLSTKINRLVIEMLVQKYRHDLSNCIPAFDGRKNLYTRHQLNFRERTFSVELNEDQRIQKFIVKIQYAATVNLDALHAVYQNRVNTVPQEVLQAIDIVVRHGPSMKLTPVGRSFFKVPPPHELNALGGGREVWFGYYTSVRPAQWKPMLNVDISATAFYESLPLVSFMCKIFGDSRREMTPADFKQLRDFHHARLNKELKGLRVKVTHLPYPRKYKVARVTKESANQIFFNECGKRTSVAEYFEKRYGRLAYPHFPCVQSGSLEHPVYIPLEEIRQSVRDLVNSTEDYLREFNIKISTDPTQLKGRVLEPPSLVFENNSLSKPREGTWELRGQHFYKAATMDRWTLVSLSRFAQRDSLDNFVKMLTRIGLELGMRIDQPLECVLENNVVKKCNVALVQNLCQKINAKMGGTNNSLLAQEKPALFQKPVIIIGADVSHPSPGDRVRPSIAACVGSLDSIPSKFHATVRIQMEHAEAKARVEIIRDLKEMVKDMLKAFFRATRHKPERIIFYRDGVSEGQFLEVRNREVSAIRLACKELSPNESYEPALTFIVVQKRHHTRFMPANDRDGVGKFRNVPPGTTVDSVVTHPLDFDFFLCSHFGIQGTSRPAHYYIVWDDSNFTADELQKLSYYLCHTYARCARSVSIPAPVYYAHLAALRAKNHILSKVDVSSSSSDSSGGSGDNAATSQYVEAVRVLEALQTSMYFV